jgi:hypothetical protein
MVRRPSWLGGARARGVGDRARVQAEGGVEVGGTMGEKRSPHTT